MRRPTEAAAAPARAEAADGAATESPFKGRTGILRVVHAFFHSIAGLRDAWRCESAFRQEVLLAAILVPAAFALPASAVERALLVGSVVLVMIVELLNSSIEAAVDRIGFERHSLAKRAKDIGSAAVLVALLLLVVVWGLIVPSHLGA